MKLDVDTLDSLKREHANIDELQVVNERLGAEIREKNELSGTLKNAFSLPSQQKNSTRLLWA
jgi:hypothetical protein